MLDRHCIAGRHVANLSISSSSAGLQLATAKCTVPVVQQNHSSSSLSTTWAAASAQAQRGHGCTIDRGQWHQASTGTVPTRGREFCVKMESRLKLPLNAQARPDTASILHQYIWYAMISFALTA